MSDALPPVPRDTRDEAYSLLREAHEAVWWKRLLRVQAPYRWHLRRLRPGFTLDIGCGNGRSLANLDGNGVGVDHNPRSVRVARRAGFEAFLPGELAASGYAVPGRFESLLLSHVVEHMTEAEAVTLLREYLHLLAPGGRVILFCPQEAGHRTDPTHVQLMDFASLRRIVLAVGLTPEREYSHPFPRWVGRFLRYNEFVCIARKGKAAAAQSG